MPDSTMLQSKDLQERYERYKAKIKKLSKPKNHSMTDNISST